MGMTDRQGRLSYQKCDADGMSLSIAGPLLSCSFLFDHGYDMYIFILIDEFLTGVCAPKNDMHKQLN